MIAYKRTWHVISNASTIIVCEIGEALHFTVLLSVVLVESQFSFSGKVALSSVRVVIPKTVRRGHHVRFDINDNFLIQRRTEILRWYSGYFTRMMK